MRNIKLFSCALLAAALAAVSSGQPPVSSGQPKLKPVAELPKITGAWDVVGGEVEGQRLDERRLAGTRLVVEGDTLTLTSRNSRLNFSAKYTLDTTKTPTTIRMVVADGPNKGQVANGIVDVENAGRLRICYTLGNSGVPTEFVTKPGGVVERMFVLKRADLPRQANDAAQQRIGQGEKKERDATKDKAGTKGQEKPGGQSQDQ